jgi:peptidyl-prolyl cis-trans isomerase C
LILEELIRQQLLIQDAEKSGVAQKKDITQAVEEFRNTLLIQETVNKLTSGISVSPLDVESYYTSNKDSFTEEAEWHVREIMVSTQQEASEIQIALLQGADFAENARTRSKVTSASEGGDLGFISEFRFPEMEKAVTILEPNGISSVTKGPDGFYIFKLEEKKGGKPLDFATVKEDIEKGLNLMKQQEAVLNYIEGLKKKTTVEKNEGLLGGA